MAGDPPYHALWFSDALGWQPKEIFMPTTYDTVTGMPSYEPEFEQGEASPARGLPNEAKGPRTTATLVGGFNPDIARSVMQQQSEQASIHDRLDQRLRQQCLEMATALFVGSSAPDAPSRIVEQAEAYYAFVTGKAAQEDKS